MTPLFLSSPIPLTKKSQPLTELALYFSIGSLSITRKAIDQPRYFGSHWIARQKMASLAFHQAFEVEQAQLVGKLEIRQEQLSMHGYR